MQKTAIFFVALLLACFTCPPISVGETLKPAYPGAVHQLIIRTDQHEGQNKLANSIGFELGKSYSYSQYADINKKHNTGTAGNYDFLTLSTGGTEWDYEAYKRFLSQKCGWETTFYSNHNLTVIHEVCPDAAGSNSMVKILKIGRGQQPYLYQK